MSMKPTEMFEKGKAMWFIGKNWVEDHTRFSFVFKAICVLPFILYLIIFKSQAQIPFEDRLDIDSESLPYLESLVLFGGSLQHWPRNSVPEGWTALIYIMDLVAGSLYLIHFFGAWLFAIGLYLYFRKKQADNQPIPEPWTFLFCLGLLNLTAVITQLCWPTAPPWYNEKYGDIDPDYSMAGDEAGLDNVDQLLGFSLFAGLYGTSPLVFASFPSLHGGWPLIIALSVPNKWGKVAGFVYAAGVWWAAMYLGHHFFVDLLGSLVFSLSSYFIGKALIRLIMRSPSRFWAANQHKKWVLLQDIEEKPIQVEIQVEEQQSQESS